MYKVEWPKAIFTTSNKTSFKEGSKMQVFFSAFKMGRLDFQVWRQDPESQ